MIGVFDSGLGGLQTLRYLVDELPQFSYCYLGDTANLPYGTKDPQWIHDRTFACCQWLFDHGCKLVILACNSASTYAIRSRQSKYPERKVLSVTVPGVEEVVAGGWKHIGVLGTQATIQSNLYPNFFAKQFPNYGITIEQVVGGELVVLIEGDVSEGEIDKECGKVLSQFSESIEALILGCTHYPIIEKHIQKNLQPGVSIINPSLEAVARLPFYLSRHEDLEKQLDSSGNILFYTTSSLVSSQGVGNRIWKSSFTAQVITI